MIAQIQVRRGTTAEWAAASPVVLEAGELGYDTTLKRLKVGDGATEWAILEWIDYGTNPNILHNWDFRINPVNQRESSGAISSGYFYDRWMRYAGTITINATYLSMPADASIEQRIEGLGLSGKAVTVSVLLGDAVISGQGTFPTSAGTESVTLTGFGTATLGYHADYMFVRITATDSTRNLQAVKLELGTVSTLAYDPPMEYGTELTKCRRYFQRLEAKGNYGPYHGIGFATSNSTMDFITFLHVPLRILPSVSFAGPLALFSGTDTGAKVTNITASSNYNGVNENCYNLVVTVDASINTNQVYRIINYDNPSGRIDLSADL